MDELLLLPPLGQSVLQPGCSLPKVKSAFSPNCSAMKPRKQDDLEYAPGKPGSAHPTPKLTIPIHEYLFCSEPECLDDLPIRGPPESPWQESWPKEKR